MVVNDNFSKRVYSERIRSLYLHYSFSISFSLAIAYTWQVVVSFNALDRWRITWLGAITLVLLLRFLYCQRNDRHNTYLYDPKQSERLYAIGILVSSCLWAIGLIAFLPSAPMIDQLFVLLMVFSMIAFSFITMSTSPLSYSCYCLPIFVAITHVTANFSSNNQIHTILLSIICYIFILLALHRTTRAHLYSIRQQVEKQLVAVELTHITAELETISREDPLTGIANRRCFDELLDIHWNHALREQKPVALLHIDIDHFKVFNDSMGHQYGDMVLTQVAQCCSASARRGNDVAARYGGEEFLVLLYDCSEREAAIRAEALRGRIEQLNIANNASPDMNILTVSIGVASCIPSSAESPAGLYRRSDLALYQAKRRGRNQIFCWGIDVPAANKTTEEQSTDDQID